MSDVNRRSFLKGLTGVIGAGMVSSCKSGTEETSLEAAQKALHAKFASKKAIRNMATFTNKPMSKVRVGIIGLGMRGYGAVDRLAKIKDVEIVALGDLKADKVARSQGTLKKNNRPAAKEFHSSPDAWKKMLELDLDLIYIVTPWSLHTPMCLAAMESGKNAACEVPIAKTVEECWQLVETSERTGKHCVMLENCCYDFFEMMTLRMVREGAFGELTHVEGAYIHALNSLIATNFEGKWRLEENQTRNGGLYQTHGIGPVAQCLDINRGNQMDYLTSISSQEAAFSAWAKENGKEELAKGYRGDMNTTLVKCVNGQTIMIQHDVNTPRPYSRIHLLQGTKGCARKWPERGIALTSHDNAHRWLNDAEMKEIEAKYNHPLAEVMGDIARKVGGHGGMDFIMDYRLIYCLKNGLPMDMNVYDGAAWSALAALSEDSVANEGKSVKVPDFTRGQWKNTAPLPIVTVDPKKLPVVTKVKNAAKQLNVH